MYDIDSAINDLRRDVQYFGFKLANIRQPIGEDLKAQISSLEAGISKCVSRFIALRPKQILIILDRSDCIKR